MKFKPDIELGKSPIGYLLGQRGIGKVQSAERKIVSCHRVSFLALILIAAILSSHPAPAQTRTSGENQSEKTSATGDADSRNPFLEALAADDTAEEESAKEGETVTEEDEAPRLDPDDLHNLRVYLHDVRVPSIGLTTASIKYVINVDNPNNRLIEAPVLVYNAFIGEIEFAVSETYLPDIPAQGHRRYGSGFIVSYIDLGRSLIEAVKNRDFELRIKGTIASQGQEARFMTTLEVRRERL